MDLYDVARGATDEVLDATPSTLRIPRALLEQMYDHARECSPAECCGYLRIQDAEVVEVIRGTNTSDLTMLYEMDEKTLLAANLDSIAGIEVAIYHSHPWGVAVPSGIDLNDANQPRDWTWVIVAGTDPDRWWRGRRRGPEVRAWMLTDDARERPVEIV